MCMACEGVGSVMYRPLDLFGKSLRFVGMMLGGPRDGLDAIDKRKEKRIRFLSLESILDSLVVQPAS